MKKIIILFSCLFLISACSNKTYKTIYKINEKAIIDNYEIIIKEKKVTKLDNKYNLNIRLNIKNTANKTMVIDKDNFSLKNFDNYSLINFTDITINKKKDKDIEIVYHIEEEKEEYLLLFYSKVVSNNILFEL